jgi:S-adenosylmethionine-dependent methyltransferase
MTTADAFARYQRSAASRLRYGLAQHNLNALHDLSRPLTVLDAAGGNGMNSAYLLQNGHRVTLFDRDPNMLAQAQERLAEAGLAERCRLVQGSLEQIAELLPGERFDLILCHHVLEYLTEVPPVLSALASLAAPGGELSVITLNPVSEVIRAILFRHDISLARRKLTVLDYDAKWFGQAVLYTQDQITAWGGQAGWRLRDFGGLRVLADYVPEAELTEAREQELLELEQALSGQEPYRRFGRYLQFAFQKRDDREG